MSNLINIIFNGEPSIVQHDVSVEEYLPTVEIVNGRFIVMLNDELVPKSDYSSTILSEGDALDVLSAISGG